MYFPTCNINLFMLFYFLCHSDVDILKIKDSTNKIFKWLKSPKNHQILYFCVVYIST